MLANWIKQATATTGTGTITLGAAATNFVSFGDQYIDGAVVQYVIEDNNGNREEGRGVYTSSGTTISRDEIVATLTSGTLAKFPVTGINLSGSATVTVSASSDTILGGGIPYKVGASQHDIPDNVVSYSSSVTNAVSDNSIMIGFDA